MPYVEKSLKEINKGLQIVNRHITKQCTECLQSLTLSDHKSTIQSSEFCIILPHNVGNHISIMQTCQVRKIRMCDQGRCEDIAFGGGGGRLDLPLELFQFT